LRISDNPPQQHPVKASSSLKIFKFNVTNSGLAVVAALTFLLLIPAQQAHATSITTLFNTGVNATEEPLSDGAIGETDDVKAAAEFAVQEQAKREVIVLKLRDISKAERQIVAGVNYRLDIVVKGTGSARKARVVVFKDLKSHYKLTSLE